MPKFIFKFRKKLASLSLVGGAITMLLVPTNHSYATSLNSIFFITKSDNGNQVHYGVETNANCSLKGSKPAYPYWKLASGRLEGLQSYEVPAFGIASQSVSGNKVVMELNGLRGRRISKSIMIRSTQSGSQRCKISAFTKINGEVTQLLKVHIDLTKHSFLSGTVHSITFYGANQKQEKIDCRYNCSF